MDLVGRDRYRNPEAFRWTVLGHLVFEDYMELSDALSEALFVYEGVPLEEQGRRCASALEALLAEGEILFFCAAGGFHVSEAATDPNAVVPTEEVRALLSRDDWWTEQPEGRRIFIAPTPSGEHAARNPPDWVLHLWGLPKGFDFSSSPNR
jgi:hypothetical protein